MHYVMSDIHGEIELFKRMIEKINLSDEDSLYILGDVINRGKSGIELLKLIKEMQNVVLIRGNHEQMFLEAYRYNDRGMARIMHDSGGQHTSTDFISLSQIEQTELLNYLVSAPFFLEIEVDQHNYYLVHASYADKNEHQASIRDKSLWKRQEEDAVIPEGTIVIFGHVPTSYYQSRAEMQIFMNDYLIGIDCGLNVVENGRLGCLCLETSVCFYEML